LPSLRVPDPSLQASRRSLRAPNRHCEERSNLYLLPIINERSLRSSRGRQRLSVSDRHCTPRRTGSYLAMTVDRHKPITFSSPSQNKATTAPIHHPPRAAKNIPASSFLSFLRSCFHLQYVLQTCLNPAEKSNCLSKEAPSYAYQNIGS